MSSNAYPLKYQCKTSGEIIRARRRADQRYSVYVPGQDEPDVYPLSRLRKNFKFIEDETPKIGVKIKRNQ